MQTFDSPIGIIAIRALLCIVGLIPWLALLVRFWLGYHVHICEEIRR